jgi:hypothetical protein
MGVFVNSTTKNQSRKDSIHEDSLNHRHNRIILLNVYDICKYMNAIELYPCFNKNLARYVYFIRLIRAIIMYL